MSIDQQRSDRRKLRAGMVFVLVLAGTALIGWGGLAAWQAVTQNNGSTASTLGVHMQNAAAVTGAINPVTCTDLTSPGACGVVFDASGIKPGYGPTQVGTVAITNIGTEASTFQLSLQSAVVSGDDGNWTAADDTLCSHLQLTVTDSTGHNVWLGSLAAMPNENITDSAGNLVWNSGATDTFSFSLALPGTANTDEDSMCTATFTWGQNGV
ncbi:MAG: hypothetical protein ABSH07_10905 [Candidatus Dormibacteria bacterium]|jgi:hypothetical protein